MVGGQMLTDIVVAPLLVILLFVLLGISFCGFYVKRLKTIPIGVWALLLVPLLATIFDRWVQEKFIPLLSTTFEKWVGDSFFSESNTVVTTVFDNLVVLGQQRWFLFAMVFTTGIVTGFSFDWLARKSDENRASKLRTLGSKFRNFSDSIKSRNAVPSEWPNNVRDLKPDMMSAFIRAKKFDLWAPGEYAYQLPDSTFLYEYFKAVGRLLEGGRFDEAKREALAWEPFLTP
jgi:hypothetical protein